MNAISQQVRGMVLNADGVTYHYLGAIQWPMRVQDQKRCGLIAQLNQTIHPEESVKARKRRLGQG